MSTPNYSKDISLDDFDALMDTASGKRPEPKLTSYGPVDPMLDPKNQPQYPVARPAYHTPPVVMHQPVVVPQPVVMSHPVPVPAPYYFDPDPMPRQSVGIHVLLFMTTGGIGNIIYGIAQHERQQAWKRRRGIMY